ncbi:MAG: hypothetical protein IPK74_36455 [Deltaproteobacteria bacterium]|nr:hypothetical protein [Deltaproteobacteria bacterium]
MVHGEVHYTPKAQRERETQQYESLPDDIRLPRRRAAGPLHRPAQHPPEPLVFRYAGGLRPTAS